MAGYFGNSGNLNRDYGFATAEPAGESYLGTKYDFSGDAGSAAPMKKGGSGMDPASAGIMVGGSFLSNYLAQRAAEEQNRKQMLAQAEMQKGEAAKNSGDMQNQALSNLMSAYRSALMGG